MRLFFFNFVLISCIYFSTRGILINEFGFSGMPDVVVSGLIRSSGFAYFFYKLINFNERKIKKFLNTFRILQAIVLFSFLTNKVTIEQLFQFETLVFYPIGICLMIIDWFHMKELIRLVTLLFFWVIIQFSFTSIYNIEALLSFSFEDYFNGFFGYPRAYHFSFFVVIVAFLMLYILKKIYQRQQTNIYYLLLSILFLTPILCGAGRLVFCLLLTIVIVFSALLKTSIVRRAVLIVISILGVLSFEIYSNVLSYGGNIYSNFLDNPTDNLKTFYFVDSFNPLLNDPILFIFGQGPGTYMSNAAQSYRPDLVYKYNESLHYQYGTDIYQGFNDIIGFIGDVGIIFFILFYYLFYQVFKELKTRSFYILIPLVLIIVYSIFFQVFDDPYYSLSVWIFVGVVVKSNYLNHYNHLDAE